MASRLPGIACISVIGKQNNPLLISLFPQEQRDPLEFSFLLSSCLDIFETRAPFKTADQDFGLLQAVDERLAMYGWQTNTRVKFVIVVDMAARVSRDTKANVAAGIRDADLKPAFRAIQAAYINLLRNPFYTPDEPVAPGSEQKVPSAQITSPAFVKEIRRIAEVWVPGIAAI
ncbi:Sedlin [Microthyrium microscopicum]|uniref:Trafficking protein particle complex subunit 2-like protein n=1 Tax=Microthyrium microscopicum TaxID=703497 RepID=A0A6A6U068_9PEZI|nr:Sedlin [Microthyrium microscopicum]